jgi:hypothetical protein
MTLNLLAEVQAALLPQVTSLGFVVVEHNESAAFGDALVVLQSGDVRTRIVRDRSQLFADLGSVVEPDNWFDSAVVMDLLGLSASGGFHERDATRVLHGLGAFIKSVWPDLTSMFSSRKFALTKQQLEALQRDRAAKRFGQ